MGLILCNRKKILFSFFILSGIFNTELKAQNWQEWTDQGKTQIRYLKQQIAAYYYYKNLLEKAYQTASSSLHSIVNFKWGDFLQHETHIQALHSTNPNLMSNDMVSASVQQLNLVATYELDASWLNGSEMPNDIRSHIHLVDEAIKNHYLQLTSEINAIVTSGTLREGDAARLNQLRHISDQATDLYQFLQHFHEQCERLIHDTRHEKAQVSVEQKLFDK